MSCTINNFSVYPNARLPRGSGRSYKLYMASNFSISSGMHSICLSIWAASWAQLGISLHDFCILFSRIDSESICSLIWGWIWMSFLMFALIPFPFARATCKTFKHYCLYKKCACLPFRRTRLLMIFMIFFDTCLGIDFDVFWHRCWLHVGIL